MSLTGSELTGDVLTQKLRLRLVRLRYQVRPGIFLFLSLSMNVGKGEFSYVRSPEVATWQMHLLHVLATVASLCNAAGLTSPAPSQKEAARSVEEEASGPGGYGNDADLGRDGFSGSVPRFV